MAFWNGPTWLRDECKATQKRYPTNEAAYAAALRAYRKAKANGEQVTDRFYTVDHGEASALFLDPNTSY